MKDERELLRGNTPTLVLAVLRDSPRHGYGIAREINRRTNNSLQFKQGTLYPALHALEGEGLIAGVWETEATERPRRVYTITEEGLAELARRSEVWGQFVEAMRQVIGIPDDAASKEPVLDRRLA
ncbi:MAG: helix-turn-helix transcriptional regulator [Cytophagales bacterium]|nr:helix-turn-helix transcriptional regulator [Armatimonadota bacterium]